MADHEVKQFTKGTHNILDHENIPKDAAASSYNWITKDGKLTLSYGKVLVGAEGAVGKSYGLHFGYRADGTKVLWRKSGTKIQYLNGTSWSDTVTGLTDAADYMFTNYSSLAGTFTIASGVDGIYLMHNANPSSYKSMYSSTKNFKGYLMVDKGRALLWNRREDKTGLYGSYIDRQDATVYTAVSNENLASGNGSTVTFSGTLAQATGTRNVFGVVVKCTDGGGETFSDNYNGVLTGSAGGTGTINYLTGAYSVTFVTVPSASANNVKADYQYQDFNSHGVTDFTKSSTRVAGEGFQFPQDEGGDAILNVLIGQDGSYYSMKQNSVYKLSISDDDTTGTNEVYRRDIGIPSMRAAVSTSKGIIFVNTANSSKPQLTILQKNPLGDNIEPVTLFPHFKFESYTFDDATVDTFDRYVMVCCRTSDFSTNNRLIMCDLTTGTVDLTTYTARCFAKNGSTLYMGSTITQSIYKVFDGYDDDSYLIENEWTSKAEDFGTERLKKFRRIRIRGNIAQDQSFEVYMNYDKSGKQLVGTVLGNGWYVDFESPRSIGSSLVGEAVVGGGTDTNIYPFFAEIKLKVPKHRTCEVTFKALGLGYLDIQSYLLWDFFTYENKMPRRLRVQQNVSLDGTEVGMANPEF